MKPNPFYTLLQPFFVFILFLLFTLQANIAKADHMMGADIRYVRLPGDNIKITITFFRDCSGIQAPDSMILNIFSSSCNYNSNLTLNMDTSFEVSNICPTMLNQSTCNGGRLQGVQEFVYSNIFHLPHQCSDWVFSYTNCCRNVAVTNLISPDRDFLYIEAMLNNLPSNGICNSSPSFSTLPVPFICSGQLFSYNHGAFDIDGDSLVFNLIQPLSSQGIGVPYVTPYSVAYPLTISGPFLFSTSTGQITITPQAGIAQNAAIALRVDEYRNGVLVGYTMRDMQIVVMTNCNNQPPNAGPVNNITPTTLFQPDVNGLGGTFVSCQGASFTYSFTISDPDPGDIVYAESNIAQNLPGSTVTVVQGNPGAIIVHINNIQQSATFTITLTDRRCTIPGKQVLGFSVIIPAVSIFEGRTKRLCYGDNQWLHLHTMNSDPSNAGTYTWAQIHGTSTYMIGTSTDSLNVFIPNSLSAQEVLTYTVNYNTGFCNNIDTISVSFEHIDLIHTVSSSLICANTPVCITETSTTPTGHISPTCSRYAISSIPYALVNTPGSPVSANSPINIGFPFQFFCTTFNSVQISQYGYIYFGSTYSGSVTTIPSLYMPNGFIALDWAFLSSYAGLAYTYVLSGVAPNRKLAINIPLSSYYYSSGGIEGQIILSETTNVIEVMITDVSGGGSPPTERGVLGIEDPTGTIAYPVNGRNNTPWTAHHEGWRFTPIMYDTVGIPLIVNWPTLGQSNLSSVCTSNLTVSQRIPIEAHYGNCLFRDTATVWVGTPNMAPPQLVTCTPAIGQVHFVWHRIPGINAYQCSTNNGVTFTTVTDTFYTATGLRNGQCVDLIVRPVNPSASLCGPRSTIFNCCALECMHVNIQANNTSCVGRQDGSVNVHLSGASPGYTYTLFPGNHTINSNNDSISFTGLAPGVYRVHLSDNRGCSDTAQCVILQAAPIPAVITSTPEVCYHNGEAMASAPSGANPPYTYTWNDPAHQTTPRALGLAAGLYQVSIRDSLGCIYTGRVQVNFSAPQLVMPLPDTICAGDSVHLVVDFRSGSGLVSCGGTTRSCINTPTIYDFSIAQDTLNGTQGTPFNFRYKSSRVQYLFKASELRALGMQPGIISAIDFEVARKASRHTIPAFNISLGYTSVNSFASFINTNMMPVYSGPLTTTLGWNHIPFNIVDYQWDGASNLVVQVCFADTLIDNSDIVFGGYTAFNSTVGAEDNTAQGCVINTINRLINRRPNIKFTSCSLAQFTWQPGFPYISNPNTQNPEAYPTHNTTYIFAATLGNCTLVDSVHIVVTQRLQAPHPLPCSNINYTSIQFNWSPVAGAAGYEVNIDRHGWINVNSATSYVATGYSPNMLVNCQVRIIGACNGILTMACNTETCPAPSITIVPETCYLSGDGSITIHTAGGHAANITVYKDTVLLTQNSRPSNSFQALNLSQGDYWIEVTDSILNCTNRISAHVDGAIAPIAYNDFITNVTCAGSRNASIQVIATGGNRPLNITVGGITAVGGVVDSLIMGTYPVIIIDQHGCTVPFTVDIHQPPAMTAAFTNTGASCNSSDGRSVIQVSGGIAPYTYVWDSGEVTDTARHLSGGHHQVTVTDAGQCQVVFYFDIYSPNSININIDQHSINCHGEANGELIVTLNGGYAPYAYRWSNGDSINRISGLHAGVYSITVSDSQGCRVSASYTLPNPDSLFIHLNSTSPTCFDGIDGRLIGQIFGGTGRHSYLWSDNEHTDTIRNLRAGNYGLTVTDANHCTAAAATSLQQPTRLIAAFDTRDIGCYGGHHGAINLHISGGSPPYFTGLDGAGLQANQLYYDSLVAGRYNVLVQDMNGCEVHLQPVLYQFAPLDIAIHAARQRIGLGDSLDLHVHSPIPLEQPAYNWLPLPSLSCYHCPDPVVNPLVSTEYRLLVTDIHGCLDSSAIFIEVSPDRNVYIPNAFTPNGDNVNDMFVVNTGRGVVRVRQVMIFDRWGELVYEAENIPAGNSTIGWDGKFKGQPLNSDNFVYIVSVSFEDGQQETYKGTIALIR